MTRPTVAALDDARETTAALLVPLDAGTWARLAVLALLVGGWGVGGPVIQVLPDATPSTGGPPAGPGINVPGPTPLPSPAVAELAIALLAVAVVLGAAYALAGAVAEFVLVVAVRDGRVRLRAPARAHLGRGSRLFGFRLAVWLVALALVGVPAALVAAGAVGVSPALLALALPLVCLGLVVLVAAGLVARLTTDFVVPTMVVLGARGTPTRGWRRLWPVLRADPVEVGLYLLGRIALGVGAGVATGLVAGLVAVAAAVPFALVGLVGYLALGPAPGPGGTAALALLAAAYLPVALVGWLLVRVPVVVFLRAFSLAALGRIEPSLDLLGANEDGPAIDGGGTERTGG
ncbi:MAG: hypothetical protein ABEJ81_07660 [Haloferacaceae archaeon]